MKDPNQKDYPYDLEKQKTELASPNQVHAKEQSPKVLAQREKDQTQERKANQNLR